MAGNRSSRRLLIVLAVAIVIAGGAIGMYLRRAPVGPAQTSSQYEHFSRAFYRGLAALDVGLLDNARQSFTDATQTVPEEPAAWANLGLTLIRLGELDAAAQPVQHAMELAPKNARLVLLGARMEIARGRLEDGVRDLRRAVDLDPVDVRTRYALAEEVERGELTEQSQREALTLYDQVLALDRDNIAALIDHARVSAAVRPAQAQADLQRLQPLAAGWPADARDQLLAITTALGAGQADEATRSLTRLRNVLARVPAYREDLSALRTPPELIADPFTTFLRLEPPSPRPAAPDMTVTFTQQAEPMVSGGVNAVTVAAMASSSAPVIVPAPALAIDWNRDFRMDLVVADASGLHLQLQGASGALADATARAAAASPFQCSCYAAWGADVELDGDLDLVVGLTDGPTAVLRNNGDATWTPLPTFAAVRSARAFAWGDVDGDADPDVVLVDAARTLHVFLNRQAGEYAEAPAAPTATGVLAVAIADANADGSLDVLTLADTGEVAAQTFRQGKWLRKPLAMWTGLDATPGAGAFRLFAADLDNNGALDLVLSSPLESRAWIADAKMTFAPLPASIPAPVFGIADFDGDGRLDLAAVSGGQPVRFAGHGSAAYHWKQVTPRAQETAGDQRINSFGVGAEVEVRAGLLVQKQVMTGLPAHFGLGDRGTIDVARIVWPNGVLQAEFDAKVDDVVVAEQRLKGSCPWVFTWDGERIGFVTDFLWRSPLGLRINAQDTAGTSQTEDWVRIRGDQLKPRDGTYDVRITAELWETHFFDHVALMTVDHDAGVEVFVDERFSPVRPQAKVVRTGTIIRAVDRARDEQGRDVTPQVQALDGRSVTTFARGEYQGVTPEHWVEFDVGELAHTSGRLALIAQGWVYPTDSSINVAIAQRGDQPRGVALDAQDASGRWRTVEPDLGFPAGKNKTMVIDIEGVKDARRLRLRTNLEVYWDALRYARMANAPVVAERLPLAGADLRYRGFSQTMSPRGDAPELPIYARLAATTPRWRDLEGYYTRYGDVSELLAGVDDRYVIMNAGDEMRLRFTAPPPRAGLVRDFVLIGDGWEKDGDYNTGYSSTVTPLPTHMKSEYRAATASLALEDDPVFRQHRDDWTRFHTRYVTPDRFLRGLR